MCPTHLDLGSQAEREVSQGSLFLRSTTDATQPRKGCVKKQAVTGRLGDIGHIYKDGLSSQPMVERQTDCLAPKNSCTGAMPFPFLPRVASTSETLP